VALGLTQRTREGEREERRIKEVRKEEGEKEWKHSSKLL
jgi:hypothetical protein